jgi:hypothetical protein
VGNPEGKRALGRPRRRWVDNIKMDLREIGWDGIDWIELAQDRDQWRTLVNTVTYVVRLNKIRNTISKCSIFWDTTLYSPLKVNRRFGGTCHLHTQSRRSQARNQHEACKKQSLDYSLTMKKEAKYSSGTSVDF